MVGANSASEVARVIAAGCFILLAYANSMQAEIGPGYKTKYDIIVGGGGGGGGANEEYNNNYYYIIQTLACASC